MAPFGLLTFAIFAPLVLSTPQGKGLVATTMLSRYIAIEMAEEHETVEFRKAVDE